MGGGPGTWDSSETEAELEVTSHGTGGQHVGFLEGHGREDSWTEQREE